YYLYSRILTEPGRMPDGSPTPDYFKTTVGIPEYAAWMEEEIRYYASRYGRMPNLIGINLGPISEPFSSERGGFLEYSAATDRYDTPEYPGPARRWWPRWLRSRFGDLEGINREYETAFLSVDQVPLPLNDEDRRFGRPRLAYYDFARSINDWFMEQYERCRKIWHDVSGRSD